MKKIVVIVFFMSLITQVLAQNFYDVVAGNGNGFRFWTGSNEFKLHFGNLPEYKYGPVNDYSIKMNMSNDIGRGWTWGVAGLTPIAAINTQGHMQLAGKLTLGSIDLYNVNSYNGLNRLLIRSLTEPNNESLVSMITGQQRGLLIKDRETMQGGLWLFGGGSNTNLVNSGGVGAGFVSDMATYIPLTTSTSAITFANGNINFFANNNLTVNQPYWPTPKMKLEISPSTLLRVDGEVRAKLVRVVTDVWADYVFKEGYKLLTLPEVERYIEEKKHLPNVPSEEEILRQGLNVGDMQKIQMEKIEEITLYLVQMKKEIIELKKENEYLKSKLENKN
jgi:hypothetical protein